MATVFLVMILIFLGADRYRRRGGNFLTGELITK